MKLRLEVTKEFFSVVSHPGGNISSGPGACFALQSESCRVLADFTIHRPGFNVAAADGKDPWAADVGADTDDATWSHPSPVRECEPVVLVAESPHQLLFGRVPLVIHTMLKLAPTGTVGEHSDHPGDGVKRDVRLYVSRPGSGGQHFDMVTVVQSGSRDHGQPTYSVVMVPVPSHLDPEKATLSVTTA